MVFSGISKSGSIRPMVPVKTMSFSVKAEVYLDCFLRGSGRKE